MVGDDEDANAISKAQQEYLEGRPPREEGGKKIILVDIAVIKNVRNYDPDQKQLTTCLTRGQDIFIGR